MITKDEVVKILDFGIAKDLYASKGNAAGVPSRTSLTQEGGLIGTPSYVSPKQACGEEVDHRSDIWSFGVTLYQMVTGQLPFVGEGNHELISAILNKTPAPVTSLRPGIPQALEMIVNKCLEKDQDRRYQTALELIADLREVKQTITATSLEFKTEKSNLALARQTRRWLWVVVLAAITVIATVILFRNFFPEDVAPVSDRKMLVVLPFENLGPAEDEYFADGITQELMARLASVRELGVIARTSAVKYKNTDKTIRQIGEELGVEYVLGGTIRWQRMTEGQNRVRVTPKLIRTSDEIHLWAESYQMEMTDIFQVQSDIAIQVVEQLDITLLETEKRDIEAMPTANLDAYHAFLRGLEYRKRQTQRLIEEKMEEDVLMAVTMFERAIQLDPSFALAYAYLSRTHCDLYHFYNHPEERLSLAKNAAQQALQLAPDLPQAHLAMGYYYYGLRDYDLALREFEIVRENRPNDDDALEATAYALRRSGNFEAAVENLSKALELNPQKVSLLFEIGATYANLREYEKAEEYYNKAISLSPDFTVVYRNKSWNQFHWKGDTEKARETLKQMPGESGWLLANLDFLDRDFRSALNRYNSIEVEVIDGQVYYTPKALKIAQIYNLIGRPELAKNYYDSARIHLENKLEERPDDSRVYASLGIAYAGLGLKEEAVRAGQTAVKLMPVAQDALIGSLRIFELAEIYTMVGEKDAAVENIKYLLSIPRGSRISRSLFRNDPTWDPLRQHPVFLSLIASQATDL